ncbi:MAG TPA: hypothetical protein VFJ10_11195, partial [Acidobacteriaceae bacterium]|nr:hypothetical protein [Acidobacteriaceae bacterium]
MQASRWLFPALLLGLTASRAAQNETPLSPNAGEMGHPKSIVLHAARLFDVQAGRIVTPGEVLVEGDRIREAGTSVTHPAGAE